MQSNPTLPLPITIYSRIRATHPLHKRAYWSPLRLNPQLGLLPGSLSMRSHWHKLNLLVLHGLPHCIFRLLHSSHLVHAQIKFRALVSFMCTIHRTFSHLVNSVCAVKFGDIHTTQKACGYYVHVSYENVGIFSTAQPYLWCIIQVIASPFNSTLLVYSEPYHKMPTSGRIRLLFDWFRSYFQRADLQSVQCKLIKPGEKQKQKNSHSLRFLSSTCLLTR